MKILDKIALSPFKNLIKSYYLGSLKYGTPYFYPKGFCDTIFKFKRLKLTPKSELDLMRNDFIREAKKFNNIPRVRRCKDKIFKIFGTYFWVEIGNPIVYKEVELGWKDKWSSPRLEWEPSKVLFFFGYQFVTFYKAPCDSPDSFWEMYLWWSEYSDEDLEKAKSTWTWVDYNTKLSSWNDNYLKKES